MKKDTQHLDYLISQYIDGCLDTGNRKSLEQTLVNDPLARRLYKDQREVQDVLDDWGNRIPLINWDQFDKQLAGRIEHETVGGQNSFRFRRWLRPMAAAAALFIAASIGYGWHAWSTPAVIGPTANTNNPVTPVRKDVHFENQVAPKTPSFAGFRIDEPMALRGPTTGPVTVDISSPDDAVAAESLRIAIRYGLGVDVKRPGSATAMQTEIKKDNDTKEAKNHDTLYPYP